MLIVLSERRNVGNSVAQKRECKEAFQFEEEEDELGSDEGE